jgi:hypothetical protein
LGAIDVDLVVLGIQFPSAKNFDSTRDVRIRILPLAGKRATQGADAIVFGIYHFCFSL